jgi:hypothetical protein
LHGVAGGQDQCHAWSEMKRPLEHNREIVRLG